MTKLVGHREVRERLRSMKDRLPPSLLFAGPQGIGKKLVALEFAREVTDDHRALDLTQPLAQTENIFFISPDGASIKIEQAREALRFLNLARDGKRLILIFDQAHLMGPQTANALLKSIEEPPPGVHFVFLTPSPSMLLPTIRSRSQVVRFAPLEDSEVVEILRGLDEGGSEPEPWLIELASGSVGVALDIAKGRDETSAVSEALEKWLAACDPKATGSERNGALGLMREALKEREMHSMAFRFLLRHLSTAWRKRSLHSAGKASWLSKLEFEKLETVTDLVLEAEADLARNVDRQLLWEQLTSRIGRVAGA